MCGGPGHVRFEHKTEVPEGRDFLGDFYCRKESKWDYGQSEKNMYWDLLC